MFPRIRVAFTDITIYETKGSIYLIGLNEKNGFYKILEVTRPAVATSIDSVVLKQDPQHYTQQSLENRLAFMKQNFSLELVADHVCCIWGFIKLLDSSYLIYVTKKKAVANLFGSV